MGKAKRKALSQKIRFEVFKRDSFTCVYCGRKAPDVVLQVDHIVPVAQGGTNDILNLVTSCVDCNQGKSDRKLSDQSVVEKQRKEMELRQERLEQIRMMGEWQASMLDIREAELEQVNNLYSRLRGEDKVIAYDYLHGEISKLIDKYGLAEVLEALRVGTVGYKGDAYKALDRLGGICANRSDPERDMACRVYYAACKRFDRVKGWELKNILLRGRKAGGMNYLRSALELVYAMPEWSWNSVSQSFYDMLAEWED